MADVNYTQKPLTKSRIDELLEYNYSEGSFYWKKRTGGKATTGRKAGSITKQGYRVIKIDCVEYKLHRVVYFYFNGKFPDEYIDHINGNKDDNRIENLRAATSSENASNSKLRADNKSGVKGVFFSSKSKVWMASITYNGKRVHIGSFKNIKDAEKAIKSARLEYHGGFANHG